MSDSPGRRLGRGLNALFGMSREEESGEQQPVEAVVGAEGTTTEQPVEPGVPVAMLPVSSITRNPFQPRRDFDEDALQELAGSIELHGLLQPILVRPVEGGYQLVAGERRWLAAQLLGLTSIPCNIMAMEDRECSEAALEENLKRKDLNPIEKAQAFQDYVNRNGCTIEDLGKRLSLDRSTVSNLLRLLELPQAVQTLILEEKLSAGHAKAILPLEEAQQTALCERIQSEGLSVRKTEEAVRQILRADNPEVIPIAGGTRKENKDKSRAEKTDHVLSLEQQFRDLLGLKVEIRLKTAESGQFIIDFSTNDDFERLTRFLRRADAA